MGNLHTEITRIVNAPRMETLCVGSRWIWKVFMKILGERGTIVAQIIHRMIQIILRMVMAEILGF